MLAVRLPFLIACSSLFAACGNSNADTGATSSSAGADSSTTAGASTTAGTSSVSTGGSSDTAGANSAAGTTTTDGGSSSSAGTAGSGGAATAGTGSVTPSTEKFSFFVTSLKAMRDLSGSQDGFGGDLTFGETGPFAGLKGADKICTTIAEKSMPANAKTWRAFLSTTKGEDGQPVDAISRVGAGPWYDRTGRLLANNVTDLATERPTGGDPMIADDLPNEDGVPNHTPDATAGAVDNHDVLTGTNEQGKVFSTDAGFTCNDWTSSVGTTGTPHCGHSWPRVGGGGQGGPGGMGNRNNWMGALDEAGCAAGAFIVEKGPPGANGTKSVGDGGGYGGIYCFALTP